MPSRHGQRGLLWWIDRWRKSTAYMDLTLEEQGAYRNLLDEATLRGGVLPADERILAKACGDVHAWKRVRRAVLARFTETPEGLRNETLDRVLQASSRNAERQSRWRERHAAPPPPPAPATVTGGVTGTVTKGVTKGVTRRVTGGVTRGGSGSGSKDQDQDQDPPTPPAALRKALREPARNLAYGGKCLQIPRFLDSEFVAQANGSGFDVTRFYVGLDAHLERTGEAWDLAFVRAAFREALAVPRRPTALRQVAEQQPGRHREFWGDECQRLHGGDCRNHWNHGLRMRREGDTAEAS